MPGGKAVVYTNINLGQVGNSDAFEVAVVSLDTGDQRRLVRGSNAAVTTTGHLVFAQEASLWAVPFDTDSLTVSGESVPVVDGVRVSLLGAADYTLADDGTLVYLPAGAGGSRRLVWVDRETGEETPLAAPPRAYVQPRISPDGTRVAVEISDRENDVWVWDLTAEFLTRLTFDAGLDVFGVWTPDSQRVIFTSPRGGRPALFWTAADGTGTAEPLGEREGNRFPQAVTPDGRLVVVLDMLPSGNLITVALSGDPVSADLLVTEFDEKSAVLSPDGRWFAYQSDASGEMEVYVRPFPDADSELHRVSTDGGTSPLWAPDGRELFYVNDGRLLAVPVQMWRSTTITRFQLCSLGLFCARMTSTRPVSGSYWSSVWVRRAVMVALPRRTRWS